MNIEKTLPIRLSKWTHLFRKKHAHHVALFHSLGIEVLFFELRFLALINLLKKGTTLSHIESRFAHQYELETIHEIIEALVSSHMVVPVSACDDEQLQAKRDDYVTQCGLETLYLLVTDSCNLDCAYCFINKGMPQNYAKKMMTWNIAKSAVDMFFANIKKNPPAFDDAVKTIIFYGGEPFLNFPMIRQTVEYVETVYADDIKALGTGFYFSIISNGTAITEEIALFVRDHSRISIAISLDGVKEVHDAQRVTVAGRGSFDDAIRGYQLLTGVGGRNNISISCTIGPHNIDRLDDMLALQKQYGFFTINMNPLLDTKAGTVSKAYMIKVSKRMIEYFVKAREQGVCEDRIMRKVRCFTEKQVHPFDCQALGSQIVCSPDGKLGVCHEGVGMKDFFHSTVSVDFDFHRNQTVLEWKKRTPLNMPQCYDCPAIGVCGGGCAYGAWIRNGSIWSVDTRFCVHSLATLDWIIWDLFAKL